MLPSFFSVLAYSAPSANEDYDPEFGEDDKDMQNDNNDDYGDEDEGEDSPDLPEPTINTVGQDFIARENETVYLPCDASNADTLVTFWSKNGDYIFQDDIRFNNFGKNYQLFPNRTLVIKNVEANYTGDYTCSVVSSETSQISITHRLFVQSSPSIISLEAANNKTVYEHGERLVLVCKASGYPKPTIIWSFKGQGIVGEGDSITIDNISHTDAGSYQCLADNKIGIPAHKAIRISVV
ncbi:protein amalgam-like, partial [Agrilus planipennis]|uniref:Protein amalgam-like n=1 Tax=Agrilus planipennis TaxID=224129 RepID=A0A7F5RHG7_AGRPL